MPDLGSAIVAAAQELAGTKYTFGGNTPTSGIDCSRLVQIAAQRAGVAMPRTAHEQVNAGQYVSSVKDAQPGDLIFFAGAHGTLAHPGHVGIYLGNGMMIDANHTGGSVGARSLRGYGTVAAVRRLDGSNGEPNTPPDPGVTAPPEGGVPASDGADLHDLGTQLSNLVELMQAPPTTEALPSA